MAAMASKLMPTTDKTSLVNALIKSQIVAGGAVIDDNATGTDEDYTWSAAKITLILNAGLAMAKDELRAGASDAGPQLIPLICGTFGYTMSIGCGAVAGDPDDYDDKYVGVASLTMETDY